MMMLLALVVVCLLAGAATADPVSTVAASGGAVPSNSPAARSKQTTLWAPQEFPISFWCGPPDKFMTLARYDEIKNAGFTHLMPPCHGSGSPAVNLQRLNLCRGAGLKAFIHDERMPVRISGVPDAKARLDAIVRDYKDHPALEGYHLVDEPGSGAFGGLAEVVAYLGQQDPKHHVYINLFPNYAPPSALGNPTYEAHVRQYVEMVKPFLVSYDHYHFLSSGDRPGFFSNLEVVRRVALEHGVHFWQIVLATAHGPYRNLTEGELRYEAMQTLAYGGKGVLWFTYWEPNDASFVWTHALIDKEGVRDPHYDMVRRINAEVRLLGNELLHATSTAVFQTGTLPPGGTAPPPGAPVQVIADQPLTVGLFRKAGWNLALVSNQSYKLPTEVTVQVGGIVEGIEWLDPTRGWRPADARLSLSAGGAVLVRWRNQTGGRSLH